MAMDWAAIEHTEKTMRRYVTLLVGLVALWSGACSRQPKPELNPWTRVAPGSWVTTRTVVTLTGKGEDRSQESETTLTLMEATEDRLVLERKTNRDGNSVAARFELPRALALPTTGKFPAIATHPAVASAIAAAADLNVITAQGEETLQIDGRSIQAKWTQYGKGASTKKEWTSPDVPGACCKRIMLLHMGEIKQELLEEVVAFEKK
jgi:hypothetical protein